MATLAETLINAAADLGKINTLHKDSAFVRELPGMIQKCASDYINNGIELNDSIYKIAKENNYNEHQVQRLVEESNNQVYMAKYASLKGNKDRDVVFDLADARIVNARLKGEENIEKTASAKPDNKDRLFKLYYMNKYASYGPDKKSSMAKIAAKKSIDALNTLRDDVSKIASEIAEDFTAISQTLILQENFNKNAQEVFNEICKRASWDDTCMNLCKDSVENSLSLMKEYGNVNKSLDVSLCKYEKTASFDMGEYSLNKEASFVKFSPVVTPNGDSVQSIDAIVKIACEVKDKMEHLSKRQTKLSDIESIFGM